MFISSNSNLVFLTFSNLSANTEILVCVVFVFGKELNCCFLYFFFRSLFFAMLGILSTLLFLWLKSTACCTLSNTCPLFAITFPLNRYLKNVYRQSTTCLLLKQKVSNFFSCSSTFPSSILWFLQADKKHVLSSWWAMQKSVQIMHFSYVFAEIKRLFLKFLCKS